MTWLNKLEQDADPFFVNFYCFVVVANLNRRGIILINFFMQKDLSGWIR